MTGLVKKIIKSSLNLLDLEIKKKNNGSIVVPEKEFLAGTMEHGLRRMKEKNVNPGTVIDLGAASGKWSLMALKCWPQAQYLLFEPLEERREALAQLARQHPQFHIVSAAAGARKETVNFFVSTDLDGSGFYDVEDREKTRKVEVTTVDEEVRSQGLKPPFFLKFDTHGFEIPILEGARQTLERTDAIVMECYGFRISKNALLLHEMCAYLEKLGFRLADAADIMRRPGDDLFWQCDLFFLRSSHDLFKRETYSI